MAKLTMAEVEKDFYAWGKAKVAAARAARKAAEAEARYVAKRDAYHAAALAAARKNAA